MSIAQNIMLETIRCAMTGELGLAPEGARNIDDYMADVDGVLTAHDLLEHVNGPEHIGGIGDELEALGAIWFGRGQCGDLSRDNHGSYYSPQENIASDVERMAQDFTYKGFDRAIPEYVECDGCEAMRWIIAKGITGARNEFAEEYNDTTTGHRAAFREYARHSLAFMAAGYAKAEAKYETSSNLSCLFWEVRDAVKPFAQHAGIEGQQFELTITADGRAYCEEHYDTDDELSCDDCSEYFYADGEEYINPQGYTQCGECVAKEAAA